MTESKNSIESFNSRLDESEERISEQENRPIEIIQSEEQKEKMKRNKAYCTYVTPLKEKKFYITGVPEGRKRN